MGRRSSEKPMTDGEYLLFNGVRSALHYDEFQSMEAVIRLLRPQIPFLGDEALTAILERVSAYVDEGIHGKIDAHYIPEWSDVRAWLAEEKQIREDIKKRIENDESKRKAGLGKTET